MKRGVNIAKHLLPLEQCSNQAYLTNELQVADILEWILEQVGLSVVYQTSFSISEEFVRRLYFIEKSGLVKEYNLILDHKATNKTVTLWPFICQVVEKTYLADNHSKVLLVHGENGKTVTVITSQNLTRGNRTESAFISTEQRIFATIKESIDNLITYHSIPLHELYRQTVGND